MKILAVVGAPNKGGTTDQLVNLIMDNIESSEKETIYLKDYRINPCIGCFDCIKTNRCTQEDDWDTIQNKLMDAEVLVLGVPTFYSGSLGFNALTHLFLERWFALRHLGVKLKVKKVVLAVVSATGYAETAINGLKAFFEGYHMLPEVEVIHARGTLPCMVCGVGETCEISGFIQMHGPGAKITPDVIPSLKKQPEIVEKAKQIAASIK